VLRSVVFLRLEVTEVGDAAPVTLRGRMECGEVDLLTVTKNSPFDADPCIFLTFPP